VPSPMEVPSARVLQAALDRVLPAAQTDLEDLVPIPSIAANPAHHGDVEPATRGWPRTASAVGAQVVIWVACSVCAAFSSHG